MSHLGRSEFYLLLPPRKKEPAGGSNKGGLQQTDAGEGAQEDPGAQQSEGTQQALGAYRAREATALSVAKSTTDINFLRA